MTVSQIKDIVKENSTEIIERDEIKSQIEMMLFDSLLCEITALNNKNIKSNIEKLSKEEVTNWASFIEEKISEELDNYIVEFLNHVEFALSD